MKENSGEKDNTIKFPGTYKPDDQDPKEKVAPTPEKLEGVINLKERRDDEIREALANAMEKTQEGRDALEKPNQILIQKFLDLAPKVKASLPEISSPEYKRKLEKYRQIASGYTKGQILGLIYGYPTEKWEKESLFYFAVFREAVRWGYFSDPNPSWTS